MTHHDPSEPQIDPLAELERALARLPVNHEIVIRKHPSGVVQITRFEGSPHQEPRVESGMLADLLGLDAIGVGAAIREEEARRGVTREGCCVPPPVVRRVAAGADASPGGIIGLLTLLLEHEIGVVRERLGQYGRPAVDGTPRGG